MLQERLRYNAEALTGKVLPPQFQVFLLVLRRNRSKELPRVKKTLQAESRQLLESHSLDQTPAFKFAGISASQQLLELVLAWDQARRDKYFFWVSFRKHYTVYFLLLVNHILIWESCFMVSLSWAANRAWGPWVLLLRAVVTEPHLALLGREKGCSHTGERVCCSSMLCCTLTLFVHWKVGQAAQETGGITTPGSV